MLTNFIDKVDLNFTLSVLLLAFSSRPTTVTSKMGANSSKKATEYVSSVLERDKRELRAQRQQLRNFVVIRSTLDPSSSAFDSEHNKITNLNHTGKGCRRSRDDKSNSVCCDFSVITAVPAIHTINVELVGTVDFTIGKDTLQLRPVRQDVDKEEYKEQLPYKCSDEPNHFVSIIERSQILRNRLYYSRPYLYI